MKTESKSQPDTVIAPNTGSGTTKPRPENDYGTLTAPTTPTQYVPMKQQASPVLSGNFKKQNKETNKNP